MVALEPGLIGGLQVPILGPSRFSRRTLSALRSHARLVDVLVAHGSSTLPAVAAATVGLTTPFLYRSVGDPRAWATTAARRTRIRAAASRAIGVVALWRGAAVFWHEMLGVRADRVWVIPNWVDARRFSPPAPGRRALARQQLGLSSDEPVALCLGALTREKRIDIAIQAVALTENHRLLVVGDGPERDALSALSGRCPGRIRLTGSTADPTLALNASDLLVMASRTEGQPAAAIEASLCGMPVVSSRVGGLTDIVLDGRSGILLDVVSPESVAAAIMDATANRAAMGETGRRYCLAQFDLERIGLMWLELLQQLHTG